MEKKTIPVYITTTRSKYIGEVSASNKNEYYNKAEELWENQGYDSPTLCHQCGSDADSGDWEIDEHIFKDV